MAENKVRIKSTGRVIEVNDHVFNDPRKLRWMGAEKLEVPAKPESVIHSAKQGNEPPQEDLETKFPEGNAEKLEVPADGFENKSLEEHNIKELRNMSKDLEGFKSTMKKADIIELIKNYSQYGFKRRST